MIRDPSDGSVRHRPKPLDGKQITAEKPVLSTAQSGLPPIDKDQANEAARLKRSREWLEEYHRRKACTGQQ